MIAAAKQAKTSSATGAISIENSQKQQSTKITIAQTVGSDKQNAAQFSKNKCNNLPASQNSSETKCETKKVVNSDVGTKPMHIHRSKVSCSPQAAAALTNTIAGPGAASTKIQHKQQKFLAAAAKCHQSAFSNHQTAIKNQRQFETHPKASNDAAWRSPLVAKESTTNVSTTNSDSEARTAATTNMQRQSAVESRCIMPLLKTAPQSCCHSCYPTEQQLCLQATPTVSAIDNNALSQPANLVPADEHQFIGKRAQQQQPSAVKPLSTKNARSKPTSATAISISSCSSGCSHVAAITNKSAKLACCASVASIVPKTTNHQIAGKCPEVANNVELFAGQQFQDQVRSVGDNNGGYTSSGVDNRSNNYQHQYYYQHHNNSYNNNINNNYHQPRHYLSSYNHHQNHQVTQAQPTPQVMAHYKFHNDDQSSVLTYEQVKRLDHVMDQVVPIHGRGNSPTLFVKLKELIRLVKHKLQNEHSIEIRDVRLNGGAASYVLAPENSQYNDLDLIFGTDLSNGDRFDVIRDVVLECLMEFHPDNKRYQNHLDQESVCDDLSKNLENGCNADVGVEENRNEVIDSSKYEDDAISEQLSRSDRSSSFESDNLNVTINESEMDRSDNEEEEEDDVRVKIEDSGVELSSSSSSTIEKRSEYESKQSDVTKEQSHTSRDEVYGQANTIVADSTGYDQRINQSSLSQHQFLQMPQNNCAIKETYVHKMVKVNDDDRWSLISLGVQQSEATNCCVQSQEQTAVGNCGGMVTYTPFVKDHHHAAANGYMSQQKQFPNSIELKFVDKMRRKFEFSVDSFQIILDSLIQFYDFAPQSTITIQKKLANSNLSSTMIDTARPIENNERCPRCLSENRILFDHTTMLNGDYNNSSCQTVNRSNHQTQVVKYLKNSNSSSNKISSKPKQQLKDCQASLTGTRGLYELSLDQGGSLAFNSSVASSSGCSSSSSVVSSSSSLSCDEDHEDLYCETDNSPSSSASTSSLLSSTTASILSSTGNSTNPANSDQGNDVQSQRKVQFSTKQTKSSKINSKVNMAFDGTLSTSTAKSDTKTIDNKVNINDCTECFDENQHDSCLDCNSSMRQCNSLIRKNLCDYGTNKTSCAVISENFYPTVIGRSEYGNFKEALYHLEKKLIATRSPEEIRGGGLLKYCNLLVKNYKPTNVYQIRTLERYMCSRFFIDFSDLNQQRAKLESYLANHFSDDPIQKFDYLTILHTVVQRSTVCLMNHELRLTLNMIRELAYNLNEQQIQQRQQHAQIQDHLQQQQSRPTRLQHSSSNQAAAQEQHYYQPYLAKAHNHLSNSAPSNASINLVKT